MPHTVVSDFCRRTHLSAYARIPETSEGFFRGERKKQPQPYGMEAAAWAGWGWLAALLLEIAAGEFALEFLNAAGGIDKFLFAGEEGV